MEDNGPHGKVLFPLGKCWSPWEDTDPHGKILDFMGRYLAHGKIMIPREDTGMNGRDWSPWEDTGSCSKIHIPIKHYNYIPFRKTPGHSRENPGEGVSMGRTVHLR